MPYFPSVSVHNTVYNQRKISFLFQYTAMYEYINHALFLSSFSTQHSVSTTFYFTPVSIHNILYYPRLFSLLFQYTTL